VTADSSRDTASTSAPVDFFISRRGAQAAVAQEVAAILMEAGYTVLVQDFDIPYSSNFVIAMHDALKRARHLIVLLTPDYDRSAHTMAEVSNFLALAARADEARRLIVMRVEDCVPDGLFAGIVFADLVGVDDPAERRRLIVSAAEGRALGGVVEVNRWPAPQRGLVGRLGALSVASTFAGKIEAFLEEYLVTDRGTGAVPFAGRTDVMDRLDRWLDSSNAPARFVLTAPAGRGKSALLVQWMKRLERDNKIGPDRAWLLVFVPISMRFNTNRPEVFYEAIAARLAQVLGESLKPPHVGPAAYYEDQCRLLLNMAVERKKPILLVIDGLDEALGEQLDPSWFPRAAGNSLRLLVTARLQVGDADSRGWVARLGWSSGVRVQSEELTTLDLAAVRELLLNSGAPLDVLAQHPDVVGKLHRLAEGEPLLLRLYVEGLWQKGDESGSLTIADLDHIEPGFAGYFADWLDRQRRAWDFERQRGAQIDEDVVLTHLAVLACAYGPIASSELGDLVQRLGGVKRGFRTELALHPLRRFVIGTGRRSGERNIGYVLSHPRFNQFLRESYFDEDQTRRVQHCFAQWGRDVLSGLRDGLLKSESVSPYLLTYLSGHFVDTEAPVDDFMQLVSEAWMKAWLAFEGGYRGFSRDVQRAVQVLASRKPPSYRSLLVRCALFLTSLGSSGSALSDRLVVESVLRSILPVRNALHLAERQSLLVRARIIKGILPKLTEAERTEALLATAASAGPQNLRGNFAAIGILAPILPAPERQALIDLALKTALALADKNERARALVMLASELPAPLNSEAINMALSTARSIPDPDTRAGCLTAVLKIADPEGRSSIVAEVLDTARRIENAASRAENLAAVTAFVDPNMRADVIAEALDGLSVSPVREDGNITRGVAVEYLAPFLSPEQLASVRALARTFKEPLAQARALVALTTAMKGPERDGTLDEAISVALSFVKNIGFQYPTLGELSDRLPDERRLGFCLEVFAQHKIGPYGEESILTQVSDKLADDQLREVLGLSLQINDIYARISALGHIAALQPDADRNDTLKQVFDFIETLDQGWRIGAYHTIAGTRPNEERIALLRRSLALAREEILWGNMQWGSLTGIIGAAPDSDSEDFLDDVLQEARKLSADDLVRLLCAAVPKLSGEKRSRAIADAIDIIESIEHDSHALWMALPVLALDLDPASRVRTTELALARARRTQHPHSIALAEIERCQLLEQSQRDAELLRLRPILFDLDLSEFERAIGTISYVRCFPRESRLSTFMEIQSTTLSDFRGYDFETGLALVEAEDVMASMKAIKDFVRGLGRADQRFWSLTALMKKLPDGAARDEALDESLACAHEVDRINLLSALERMLPTLVRLEGAACLNDLRQSVSDVGRLFP
jgi:hypothetical protein